MQHFAKAALLTLTLAAPLALAGELEERAALREPIERAYPSGDYETIERLETPGPDLAFCQSERTREARMAKGKI